jgi:hypothetical protein
MRARAALDEEKRRFAGSSLDALERRGIDPCEILDELDGVSAQAAHGGS